MPTRISHILLRISPKIIVQSSCFNTVFVLGVSDVNTLAFASIYALMGKMTTITRGEFESICAGIYNDREAILRHNPMGTHEETLLWMLLNCLTSYMSLSETETPCFTGMPDAKTYREAILFVLKARNSQDFDAERCIDKLCSRI